MFDIRSWMKTLKKFNAAKCARFNKNIYQSKNSQKLIVDKLAVIKVGESLLPVCGQVGCYRGLVGEHPGEKQTKHTGKRQL